MFHPVYVVPVRHRLCTAVLAMQACHWRRRRWHVPGSCIPCIARSDLKALPARALCLHDVVHESYAPGLFGLACRWNSDWDPF